MKFYYFILLFSILSFVFLNESFAQSCDETAQIDPPVIEGANFFGREVDVDGDRLLVGAVLMGANDEGICYVADYDGTNWIGTEIIASDGAYLDYFGHAIDLDGDRFVASAPFDDDNGSKSGSVYIYDYDGSNWIETKINPSNAAINDHFGWSVAVDGDRIVVGEPFNDSIANNTGIVFVFEFDGTTWNETANLMASDGLESDYFGKCVKVKGDRIIVGGKESVNGAVYVFDYNGVDWVETILTASDGQMTDLLGESLDIGTDLIIAGAPFDDDNGNLSGSAYLFEFDGTNWSETKILPEVGGDAGDEYGLDVAYSPGKIVIGAMKDDTNGLQNGCVYLYEWDGSDWIETIHYSSNMSEDRYGEGVAIDENRMVVGTGFRDIGLIFSIGLVYVYDCCSTAYYADVDGDSYGNSDDLIVDCIMPTGYVDNNIDCNDNDPDIHPGSVEICDGLDNNCDDIVDEGCGVLPLCDDVNLVIPVLLQDVYRAEVDIQTEAVISSNDQILFAAGNSIELSSSFEVIQGTVFEAVIESCDNN